MKHTLFPIQYYHCKIHNHKELFGSLLDSAKHLLKDAQGKWNCSVYTTYFEEQDVVDADELGKVLAPYLYPVSYTHLTLPTICSV